MVDRYIKLRFVNAKLFPKNKKTKDYIANVSITKKGKLIFTDSKRGDEEITSFKEPITVHQISNMLHTLIGERPVPSFRETFYNRNESIFNLALNSFIKIDSPKVKQKLNGEDVETFIPEFTKVGKSKFDSWSTPNKLHWFKIKKYMGKHYQQFVSEISELLGYNVEEKPFEDLFNIAIGDEKFNPLLEWLETIKKKPMVNFLTKEKFNRSEVTRSESAGLGETILSGIDKTNILDGEILIPYQDDFVKKLTKTSTNILDGGYCEIVGVYYVDELENTNDFTLVSEISDEKY